MCKQKKGSNMYSQFCNSKSDYFDSYVLLEKLTPEITEKYKRQDNVNIQNGRSYDKTFDSPDLQKQFTPDLINTFNSQCSSSELYEPQSQNLNTSVDLHEKLEINEKNCLVVENDNEKGCWNISGSDILKLECELDNKSFVFDALSSQPFSSFDSSGIEYYETLSERSINFNQQNNCNELFFTSTINKNCDLLLQVEEIQLICHFCGKFYKDDKIFAKHVKKHNLRFDCIHCSELFSDRLSMLLHIKNSHKITMLYNCNICLEEFTTLKYLEDHTASCVFSSSMKTTNVSNKTNIKNIMKLKLNRLNCFKCDHCEKCFQKKISLANHLKIFHNASSTFQCSYCNKIIRSKKDLINHIKYHLIKIVKNSIDKKVDIKKNIYTHKNLCFIRCKICKKSFNSKKNLIKHNAKNHMEKKIFECHFCNKKFRNKLSIVNHINLHLVEQSSRNECRQRDLEESVFKYNHKEETKYLDQVLTVPSDKSLRYKCDFCSKEFKQLINFQKHTLLDNENNSYDCNYCNKKIKLKSCLKKHIECHLEKICLHTELFTNTSNNLSNMLCYTCGEQIPSKHNSLTSNNRIMDSIDHQNFVQEKQSDNNQVFNQYSFPNYRSEKENLNINLVNPEIDIRSKFNLSYHENTNEISKDLIIDPKNKPFIHSKIFNFHQVGNSNLKFSCVKCDISFSNYDILIEHMESHEKNFCVICDRSFLNKINYRKHMQNKHINVIQHPCNQCNKFFSTYGSLKKHCKVVHEKIYEFECNYCNKKMGHKSQLKGHISRHHHNETGERHSCNICAKIFFTRSNLLKHQIIHSQKRMVCYICGKSYSGTRSFEIHMKMHINPDKYKCQICERPCLNKINLSKHILTHSGCIINCNICDRPFKSTHTLKNHLDSVHGQKDKNFLCDQCPKSFNNKQKLQFHTLVHTGQKQFVCKTCGKKFARIYTLNMHKRVHTGEKPYRCIECNKSFSRPSNFKVHMKMEHYGRICDICEQKFDRSVDLIQHERTHKKDNKFFCYVCDIESYYFKKDLKNHILKCHKNL
ncbi:zinc finger protein 569-like isoform X2 [Daktulosphaira vitifoliae]|uniref:zinc finger protein 569-like isoform X2 n=1 Tax=Daktulosphaira vitifoliae TaxID=58002 RepID=UPI0021A97CBF|nr:zinc finger protein 569-like isoform X2 [Daktulosphaira vitifoliae]XP_050533457.1 zinc finger protein 569-like isoform X2 [Daktulosphaira vitifoliae]